MDNSNKPQYMKFNDWGVAVSTVLNLDPRDILFNNIVKDKRYILNVSQFFNVCHKHAGWQIPIMASGDEIMKTYLFYNGPDYTAEDERKTKNTMIEYFENFITNAIEAGYSDFKQFME